MASKLVSMRPRNMLKHATQVSRLSDTLPSLRVHLIWSPSFTAESCDIELELTPQGTLAERCAAGGKGIPAFYTPAGVGTVVQTGDLPSRNKPIGSSGDAKFPDPKDVKVFDGKPYLLERSITGDYAFVKAFKADKLGN
ncbi:hypothetical protein BFJ63_vAg19674, partial [Fusarium oxysporum f. sp. narcissi]